MRRPNRFNPLNLYVFYGNEKHRARHSNKADDAWAERLKRIERIAERRQLEREIADFPDFPDFPDC